MERPERLRKKGVGRRHRFERKMAWAKPGDRRLAFGVLLILGGVGLLS